MTDKMAGGAKDAPAAGYNVSEDTDLSLAQKIKSRLSGSSDNLPQHDSSVNALGTTKNLNNKTSDGNQVRRMRLDKNTSYGMKVQRPESDIQSGVYQVLSKPQDAQSQVKDEKKVQLICGECGSVTEEMRLTCPDCGNYFDSTVSDTSFELAKSKARKTQELATLSVREELSWQHIASRRITAKFIDLGIVFSSFAVIASSYLSYANRVIAETPTMEPLFTNVTFCVIPGLAMLALIVYSASFESSMGQATPGKIAMGLSVCDKNDKQLSFSRAIFRGAITYLPVILALVAVWFTKLVNPALESLSEECMFNAYQVFGTVSAIGVAVYGICFTTMPTDKDKRTLGDSITGTKVVER